MALVYLGLGTNLGNKEHNLQVVITALSTEIGEVLRQSTFYSSKPWGFDSENDFLNAVVLIQTKLTPTELLSKTQEVENKMGRATKTTLQFADRLIDIDILLYDNIIVNEPELKIPHQLLHLRDFVLIPLSEIAPDIIHPLFQKTIRELREINS